MTKRHFIALADVLRRLRPDQHPNDLRRYEQWQKTVDALADFCRSQNPQFDRQRWLGYIAGTNGPNGGSRP